MKVLLVQGGAIPVVAVSGGAPIQLTQLAAAIAAIGAQPAVPGVSSSKSYQVSGSTTAGAGTATVNIEGSMDNVNFVVLGTVTLTLGVAVTSNGFSSQDRFAYIRANVTALTGTNATINAYMGF